MHACVMTVKGKMNADVWLSLLDDVIRLDAPPGLGEVLAARFERYIIADDVTLEDVTRRTPLFHLVTDEEISHRDHGGHIEEEQRVTATRFRLEGVDILGQPDEWPVLSPAQAESFRIEQGVPVWGRELTDDTIPVEAGLDQDAIDYHKGCYIGQEVISRIKSVGHVNRNLVRLDGPAGLDLPAGTLLFSGTSEVGRVTSSAANLDLEKTVALAYLKRTALGSPLTRPAGLTIHSLIP